MQSMWVTFHYKENILGFLLMQQLWGSGKQSTCTPLSKCWDSLQDKHELLVLRILNSRMCSRDNSPNLICCVWRNGFWGWCFREYLLSVSFTTAIIDLRVLTFVFVHQHFMQILDYIFIFPCVHQLDSFESWVTQTPYEC